MNAIIAIAAASIMFNVLCIREMKRKQVDRKALKDKYKELLKCLDKKETQVTNLVYEILELEGKVN